MEFLLFLLFVCFCLIFLGAISYYSRILFFRPKESYNRDEITSLTRAVPMEILRILESGGSLVVGLGLLLAGAILSALWARLGGLVGSPHYAHAPGNYFFHFPLFFLVFSLAFGFLKDAFGRGHSEPGKTFWENSQSFAVGLGAGALAKSLSSYGSYHEMYFAFSLLNLTIITFLSAYVWNGERIFGLVTPGRSNPYAPEDDYDSAFDENEDFSDLQSDFESDLQENYDSDLGSELGSDPVSDIGSDLGSDLGEWDEEDNRTT